MKTKSRAGKARTIKSPSKSVGTGAGSAFVRPQWEYRIEYVRVGAIDGLLLEKLGASGWEMCAAVSSTNAPSDLSSNWPQTVMFWFKRQREPNKTAQP